MPRLARFLELLIRFAAQRVALALLRADVQKTDARIFDAEHFLRVVAAKIRKLQQVFDRALGVRAAVDEYRLALGRRDGRRERRAAQAADALDEKRRAREERARAAALTKPSASPACSILSPTVRDESFLCLKAVAGSSQISTTSVALAISMPLGSSLQPHCCRAFKISSVFPVRTMSTPYFSCAISAPLTGASGQNRRPWRRR